VIIRDVVILAALVNRLGGRVTLTQAELISSGREVIVTEPLSLQDDTISISVVPEENFYGSED